MDNHGKALLRTSVQFDSASFPLITEGTADTTGALTEGAPTEGAAQPGQLVLSADSSNQWYVLD